MKALSFCTLSEAAQDLHSLLRRALLSTKTLKQLQRVHSRLITLGFQKSVFFSGNLISKYGYLRDPISALSIFHENFPTIVVYHWNSTIRALTHNGLFSKAIELYTHMKEMNVKPDRYTFPSVINACGALMDVEMGRVVHNHVLEMGFEFDLYTCNALIDMYSRIGDLGKARKVFDEMTERDLVSWNTLISGYSANGYWEEALQVYNKFRGLGLQMDSFTFSSVLLLCGGLFDVNEGRAVHGLVQKSGIKTDVVVCNGLIGMYFTFERLEDAQRVFDLMEVRDSVSWNTMICGYTQMHLYEESIVLFREMVSEFRPDLLTMAAVLRACAHLQDLKFGRFIHDFMTRSGLEYDVLCNNILIDMYVKCGDLSAAQEVFDTMKDKDIVSWNTLINGYTQIGKCEKGMQLFKMMRLESKLDSVTYLTLLCMCTRLTALDTGKQIHCDVVKLGFEPELVLANALIDMYSKCGQIRDSLIVFENMKFQDIVSWNTIIAAFVQAEDVNLVFRMISQMRTENLMPDAATMLGILPMCSLLAAQRQGKEVHACVLRLGLELDTPVGNALVEMYSKCGYLRNAIRVFGHMKMRDVVTWTVLVTAYGMYGEGKKALQTFQRMKKAGITPDHVAFVAILYACSHSGLVDDGLACFEHMKDYNIEPRMEHYACVVDLLSRSGLLSKAEKFILSMPFKPDAGIWGALLSACRARGDIKIAERVSQRIIQLDTDDTGYYVLASNFHASLANWDKVKMIRESIKTKQLNKLPGRSWVEINKHIYVFESGDKSFEQYEEVIKFLEVLAGLLSEQGYVADLQYALHDVGDDEKLNSLCAHSERLAIAFGLLNTKPGTPLQIMKNLRVCGDCHTWTKYLTKVMQREILVRDANRFHLFQDGTCSCGDHW